uniref:Myosin, light chain kinase 5 n=1 Tax=Neogobius melanostomus TaxID=47308 RepID=A0A8C6T2Y5_9GOBI
MEKKESSRSQSEEAPAAYSHITIDSSHKVTDHYILQEKLGVGKFGNVYKLTHRESGGVRAGKFYKGRRAKEREAARKEIELMNHLHHPKLVQCLGAYDHRLEMVMVMEFIAGGELFERIVDDSFEHTETSSAHYMQQILEGVAFMHQKKILHLDLKPENIVCVDTSGTEIKIIDFGLASRFDDSVPLKVMHGTPEFVAPEVINYEQVSPATDMWSIGVICYILLSGESPFQGNSDAETLALVTAAQYEFDEESFEEISDEAQNFISSLLNKAPRRRMTGAEAVGHPWMAAFDSDDTASSKSLSKEKMKKFLARQKWKVQFTVVSRSSGRSTVVCNCTEMSLLVPPQVLRSPQRLRTRCRLWRRRCRGLLTSLRSSKTKPSQWAPKVVSPATSQVTPALLTTILLRLTTSERNGQLHQKQIIFKQQALHFFYTCVSQ